MPAFGGIKRDHRFLIAGRIGSAMAAEIGSMRVYQEIDALRTMNISPIHYLVLPRLVAIAVALPLLVTFSILVGWLGGAVVCVANDRIALSFTAFFSALRDVVEVKDVANGVFKSLIFALVIAVVSCHQGLITRGGPRGIGRSVTKAVVNSMATLRAEMLDRKIILFQDAFNRLAYHISPVEGGSDYRDQRPALSQILLHSSQSALTSPYHSKKLST